ncbi:sigma-70 family RNA polymerase sigma factor [Streptomyces sp. NPDC052682]|uniref:sigma-70 family RNA polymerase sigma factor n=1 Tax=Streptomyces sp. NPDC052682 TaxID=3154954 RepID=UPI003414386F
MSVEGGRAGGPSEGDPGRPSDGGVPAQRDRREDGALPLDLPASDADLVGRMRAGDDTAYEELYRRHAPAVRRYARTCCRDAHTADDLTAEVFAGMLQAVRGGSGPRHAVRAYLLTSVRRVAAGWTRSARREQLVDDFAVFATQAARAHEVSDEDALDLGADVRALREAERSLAVRAFRSLPERWQAVLWHTEVEDESPSEVATLFGLDANGTRVLASRAREGLRQAYLQAHVSAALADSEECARYADQLGTYARGRLRTRAERGLRKHLEECARCRLAASQIEEVAGGIPAVVPVAVLGWLGATGYAKVAGLVAGGAGAAAVGGGGAGGGAGAAAAGGGGAAAGAGGGGAAGGAGAAAAGGGGAGAAAAGGAAGGAGASGGAVASGGAGAAAGGGVSGGAGAGGGAVVSEGLGVAAKVGIAAGVAGVTAAAALALVLAGNDTPSKEPHAAPPPASSAETGPAEDTPTPSAKEPGPKPPALVPARAASPAPAAAPSTPEPTPTSPSPSSPSPTPATPSAAPEPPRPDPSPTPNPTSTSTPTPPPPPPAPEVYPRSAPAFDVTGDGTRPETRLAASDRVGQRSGLSVAGRGYAHGVTVRGHSSVTVDLDRACTAFDAVAGVDDPTMKLGKVSFSKVSFSVQADGVPLWNSGVIDGGAPAVPVHVDLTGHGTVRLVVEPHGHVDSLALADWAESRFTCA